MYLYFTLLFIYCTNFIGSCPSSKRIWASIWFRFVPHKICFRKPGIWVMDYFHGISVVFCPFCSLTAPALFIRKRAVWTFLKTSSFVVNSIWNHISIGKFEQPFKTRFERVPILSLLVDSHIQLIFPKFVLQSLLRWGVHLVMERHAFHPSWGLQQEKLLTSGKIPGFLPFIIFLSYVHPHRASLPPVGRCGMVSQW